MGTVPLVNVPVTSILGGTQAADWRILGSAIKVRPNWLRLGFEDFRVRSGAEMS
jgi:hypothetical protein